METTLRADCSRCAALCCIALAFDRSEAFPFDKPAGARCRHLGAGYECTIHAERSERGFSGCVHFDCLGAGQKVTAMFPGKLWQDDGTLKPAIIDAFSRMRQIHELMSLVVEAGRLPLNAVQRTQQAALLDALEHEAKRPPETLATLDLNVLSQQVKTYLEGLQDAAREYTGGRHRTNSA